MAEPAPARLVLRRDHVPDQRLAGALLGAVGGVGREGEVGFNWFWRLDPRDGQSFWRSLRERGGRRFARSVDWLGLDVYAATLFPLDLAPGGERDAIVTALGNLRCFARGAGIRSSVPIKIEENGWPIPSRRCGATSARPSCSVRTVNRFRGTFGVTDYRSFNPRDGDSTSPLLFQRFGLLESDHDRRPAFDRYRRLVRELG
jgi:hypothetical protein